MKPERPLVAARPLARHSTALLRPAPSGTELLPALARAGERLARNLRNALAPLLGGASPMVVCAPPTEQAASECALPDLVAYSLYAAGVWGHPVLSVVEGETVLCLLDRAFGGSGEVPSVLPRELSLSAELMTGRIEAIAAQQFAAALGPEVGDISPLRRAASLAELGGLAADTRVAMLELTVREGGRPPWSLRIAVPMAALADLTGLAAHRPAPPRRAPANPMVAPFAEMPLMLRAVLVDIPLPLSALGALEVGQILAVPVARNVPLRIAESVIGHGTIGAVDDRVAIQLTQLS
ncbi:MAG: FliM/FliN family flagellar motor switch protein [Novosphingobium sp.]